ncbi:MAG: protein kinase domain-containing protein [Prosthecobacter sp.]|uniref:protein kinase domain-containing protein n=1 Tax=Prosthecobacter sp. TaxID=1965333 RepID=UPI0038FD4182
MWQPPSLDEMQAMLPQYQFVSLLGRGGMGAVYKAVQMSLDRAVAVKVLPGDLIDDVDAQFAERFKNEARTMAKMNHPAIVNVFDFGETQTGLLYIVMEFIDGTDVAKMIATQGKLPVDYALAITAHVCDALAYAHKSGIIHRDIKPANILINMDGAVKVADFGLAKSNDTAQGGLTKTNMAMGTPDFVAPEALMPGVPLDGRADLYAIGVMLYQMLTGEIPRGMWTMPGAKLGTDPRFDAIIGKAMQTDREARYQTAAEIRRDLDVIMTVPLVKAGDTHSSAAIPKQSLPARNASRSDAGGHIRKEAAELRSGDRSHKKSSTGFYLGMAATVIVLGAMVFLFSGGKKSAPEPESAGKTAVVSEKPTPKPKTPKTASPAPAPRVPLTAPVPTLTAKAVDVLPVLVLGQDVVYGDWKMQPDGLAYGGRKGKVNSRVELPFNCSGSYLIEAEISTVPTPGDVVFHLPYAKENGAGQDDISFMVDHAKATRAGFAYFGGESLGGKKNPAWADMASPLGQKNRLTVKVELKKPGRIALSAWLDGRPLVGWEGERSLSTGSAIVWRPNNPSHFAIGTTLDGTVFHRIRVEALDGEIKWQRDPATVTKVAPAPMLVTPPPPAAPDTVDTAPWANAIALLPLVDVEKDTVKGKWQQEGGELVSNGKSQPALAELPVIPPEEYDLRVRFTKKTGNEQISLVLARVDRSFVWHGGDYANTIFGFGNHQGEPGIKTANKTLKIVPACFDTDRAYAVQIAVRKSGVTAYLDGVKISELPADLAEMQVPVGLQLKTAGTLGIGTVKTSYTVHAVELREVTGKMKYLREQPVADLVAQRLAQIEQQFLAAYDKQAGAAHKTAVADLNTKFSAALDRSIATVSQAGKLDEALALRNEKTLIQTSGTVPAEDAAETPATLKTLRKTYRTTMATLLATRDKNAAPLHAAYDRALAAYQEELTKAQKLDDALRVKAVRDHVSTQREKTAAPQPSIPSTGVTATSAASAKTSAPIAPTAPPLPADKVLPPPPKATPEEVRALCEWVLGKGGSVEVLDGGQRRTVKSLDELPKSKLTLLHFFIYELPMDDEGKKWLAVLGRVPELESMYFNKNPGTMPMEVLRGLTKVKSLRLTPTAVDDAAFAHLTGLKSLEKLAITYMCKQFTGTGLGYINENLLEFSTDSQTISAEGLAYLPRFKKLRRLDLTNSAVTDVMLQGLAALPDLEELEVTGTKLDGSFLAHLPTKSKLKRLVLSGVPTLKPEHLIQIGKLKQLEIIIMPPVPIGDSALAALAGLGALRELNFEVNTTFNGEGFKGLKGFSSLTNLFLSSSPVTDAGLEAIASAMPGLTRLDLSKDSRSKGTFTPEGFGDFLRRMKNLTSLQLGGDSFTDAWMPAIAQAKGVTYMMLTYAKVTDQGVAHLMKLPLGYLRLDGTLVTDAVVPILKTCPTVTNVPVGGTKMTDAGKAELQRVLEAHRGK